MQRTLSFDSTPALSVPLRFLLTAPAFGLAAALILLWQGEAALVSRWSPATLAITHLLTLGYLSMCMIGSLLQILPVVLGVSIPRSDLVAPAAHALLTAGAAALSAGFLLSTPVLFQVAVPLLLAAFGMFLLVGASGVWHAREASPILATIRLALAGLAVTLALGVAAASVFGWQLALPLVLLTDLHAGWGLLGWVFLLTAGVAYQVVPMFQSTAAFPLRLTRWFGVGMLGLLLGWSAALASGTGVAWLAALLVGVLVAGFAGYTLWLIAHRRRPQVEASTRFWQLALGSLAACALLWPMPGMWQALAPGHDISVLLGVLFIGGFGVTAVNGMLYKIVPFLAWYHLQHSGIKAPNVRQFLPEVRAMLQFRVHFAAMLLLAGAAVFPAWLARAAGLAFALSMLLLWINLWRAMQLYRKTAQGATKTPAPRPRRVAA